MPYHLTAAQALALAPDPSTAKAGQSLAVPRKWAALGSDGDALWGLCQGSGKDPYRVQIDLRSDLAFRCSCPSRKLPCKHVIGLLTLAASELPPPQPRPEWVIEWLEKRAATATKRAAKPTGSDPAQHTRRTQARETRILAGLDELELWMRDLVRQGLAASQGQPYRFWDAMGARLVDAQAPGLARLVRGLAGVPISGEGWQTRMLGRLGHIHLLTQSFRQLDSLRPEEQADVRAAIGLTTREDEVLALPGVSDTWDVLGQSTDEEDTLKVQRNWLYGRESQRFGLALQFAAGPQQFDVRVIPGSAFSGVCHFYPGTTPLRVVLGERRDLLPVAPVPAPATFAEATAPYADALARNPWLMRWPLVIDHALVSHEDARWYIHDGQTRVPAPFTFDGWQVLARTGGAPVRLFGEWDGGWLTPLCGWFAGEWFSCAG